SCLPCRVTRMSAATKATKTKYPRAIIHRTVSLRLTLRAAFSCPEGLGRRPASTSEVLRSLPQLTQSSPLGHPAGPLCALGSHTSPARWSTGARLSVGRRMHHRAATRTSASGPSQPRAPPARCPTLDRKRDVRQVVALASAAL